MRKGKSWWRLGMAGILLGGWTSTAWCGVVCEEKKTEKGTFIEVVTPSYKIAIDPQNAGHVTSWTESGPQEELGDCGLGIANFVRQASATDFTLPWEYEIKKPAGAAASEKLEIVLKSGPANQEKLDCLELRKTFIFRSDTPYIQVRMEAFNAGSATSAMLRTYSDFRIREEKSAAVFQQGASTLLNNPGTAKKWEIWKDAGKGWGGISVGNEMYVIIKSCPETMGELVTYADGKSAAYEIRFTPCAMDKGEILPLGDMFMAPVRATSADEALKKASGEIYTPEVRALAEAKPMERKDEIVLDKDSRRILVVGRFDTFGLYRVNDALAKSPELSGVTDKAVFYHCDFYPGRLSGFPASVARLAKYRMIVFIDTPSSVLSDKSWRMVEQFVQAGGTVVFAGDHAADYEGKEITKIMPVYFDDTKRVENAAKRKMMNDRSEYAPLEPVGAGEPLTGGLDFDLKTQVSVHKSVVKKDAVVLLKARQWPVLSVMKVGKGAVYSFPVCLTDRNGCDEPEYPLPGQEVGHLGWDRKKLSPELVGERARSIFLWKDYGNLWRRIAHLAIEGENAPGIRTVKTNWVNDGEKLDVEFTAVNIPADARAMLTLKLPEAKERIIEGISLKDGKGVAEIKGLPVAEDIGYALDIMEGKNVLVRKDGIVVKNRPASFELILGHHKGLVKVYRRDYEVPYEVTFAEGAKGKLELSLTDPWGKEVWKTALEANGGKNGGNIPLKGLAVGHYRLIAMLGDEAKFDGLEILEGFKGNDQFYVSQLGGMYIYGTDSPEEETKELKNIADGGLNLVGCTDPWRLDMLRWPGRHMRERGERVFQAGMTPIMANYIFTPYVFHKNDVQMREDIRNSQDFFDYMWGMSPDIQAYVYDECGGHDTCRICNDAYVKRYGGALPKTRTDPGYYRFSKIYEGAFVDLLTRKSEMWQGKLAKKQLWGIVNEEGLVHEGALSLGRSFGFGLDLFSDSQSGWRHQYSADMALAANDYNPDRLALQIEADSLRGATPVAAQRGQEAYMYMARGCRYLQWFDWDIARFRHDLGISPQLQRYECVKRATQEARRMGPILAGMKRPKAQMAMLVPNAAICLGEGQAYETSVNILTASYKAAQVACGNIDFLYYQHIKEGKLDDYKLMLLAGNEWIEEEVLDIIGKWVAAGGTLLVVPQSGKISEELKPTRFLAETCPVKFGDKLENVRVDGFERAPNMEYALESSSGKTMYSYADGKPAAYTFTQGKGRVMVLGFVPPDARAIEKIFGDLKLDPAIARSGDMDASASMLKSGESYYCLAINSEDKAKDVELNLKIEGAAEPVALDMLTGKQVEAAFDSGVVKMRISLEPFWGRAIALLPAKPEKIVIEAPETVRPGEDCAYRIRVMDGNGKIISGRIPFEISVTDGSGRQRPECGGYHVTEDGVYEKNIRMGTNEPVGEWKIDVKVPWGGLEAKNTFMISN